jgi:GntR family transcriptional regulator
LDGGKQLRALNELLRMMSKFYDNTIRRYNAFMPDTQGSPLYSRVETALASEIADGDLEVGDQLPTEDSLISRFGVSRITVRRAIQNLVSRGLVEIHRGKGTFVAAPKITQNLAELSGFVEDMHALGRKPTARVIGKEVVTADATVASRLALTRGERVVRIRRVRLAMLLECPGQLVAREELRATLPLEQAVPGRIPKSH